MKCKTGYKQKDGKCVKKKTQNKQPILGLEPSQRFGIFAIILSFIIWGLKPYQDCAWYDIFCHAGSATFGNLFGLIALITLIGGVAFLLKIDKLIFK